ncbi:MAG: M20/M25/M40 family metallo-hydrolase [Deltaproteobacteria bacterium]
MAGSSEAESVSFDIERARSGIDDLWESSILPALTEYIRIPAKSIAFDREWAEHGHLDAAVALAERWARAHAPAGATIEVVRLGKRTPVLVVEAPGSAPGSVLLYGHLDKQPEMVGWEEGLGAWEPMLRDGRLYGRGGADDGYAVFASLAALRALDEQGTARASAFVLIECSEESGSPDLPAYVEHLAERIGQPDLVVCLDSGCGDYERLWHTTSLRGVMVGDLSVEILREGVHSGDASGVVPSSFRILRSLLDRLEDPHTGEVKLAALHTEIPAGRRAQAAAAAEVLGDAVYNKFPWAEGAGPVVPEAADGGELSAEDRRTELVLARTWRPTVSVTGADGLPAMADAGNVLRPSTSVKLSLRLPPTIDPAAATRAVREVLVADPPYGAKVTFRGAGEGGWEAPALAGWLEDALDTVSEAWFGAKSVAMGEGGSIPFMGMLGEKFPDAQFVITGVLGPHSNAHGPNEFLEIKTARRLTGCVAQLLALHAAR